MKLAVLHRGLDGHDSTCSPSQSQSAEVHGEWGEQLEKSEFAGHAMQDVSSSLTLHTLRPWSIRKLDKAVAVSRFHDISPIHHSMDWAELSALLPFQRTKSLSSNVHVSPSTHFGFSCIRGDYLVLGTLPTFPGHFAHLPSILQHARDWVGAFASVTCWVLQRPLKD